MPSNPPPAPARLLPPPVIALAEWIVPGLGYYLLGQRSRGITVGVTIFLLFLLGLLIGGIRVVDPPSLGGSGTVFNQVMQKPWFIGQALTGLPGVIAAIISQRGNLPVSHARVNEIGTLYTAVAGMLNLITIIDASYRATHEGSES